MLMNGLPFVPNDHFCCESRIFPLMNQLLITIDKDALFQDLFWVLWAYTESKTKFLPLTRLPILLPRPPIAITL